MGQEVKMESTTIQLFWFVVTNVYLDFLSLPFDLLAEGLLRRTISTK